MNILITPGDIIRRTLWSNYKKFVLHDKTEDEIKKIIEEDKPCVINENDAFVIGLLKCVETDNLIHRFNQHIHDILQLNSIQFEDNIYVSRNVILKEIVQFKNRFPLNIKLSNSFEKGIKDLTIYLEKLKEDVEKMDIKSIKVKEKNREVINSKLFRKLLNL